MSYTINRPGECLDDETGECEGAIELTVSGSGETRAYRCAAHAEAYFDRMDRLDRDVQSRYPGWNTLGSVPPPWFDPTAAGERWGEV